jgi:hypothetical protein
MAHSTVVVLPAPLGLSTPSTSPRSTRSEIDWMATTSPYFFVTLVISTKRTY